MLDKPPVYFDQVLQLKVILDSLASSENTWVSVEVSQKQQQRLTFLPSASHSYSSSCSTWRKIPGKLWRDWQSMTWSCWLKRRRTFGSGKTRRYCLRCDSFLCCSCVQSKWQQYLNWSPQTLCECALSSPYISLKLGMLAVLSTLSGTIAIKQYFSNMTGCLHFKSMAVVFVLWFCSDADRFSNETLPQVVDLPLPFGLLTWLSWLRNAAITAICQWLLMVS